MSGRRGAAELEAEIGRHLRARRIEMGLRQTELAERANVSTVTLSHLESGKGANLTSLVKVLRALEADDWIDQLAPAPEFSPLAVLEQATGASAHTPQARQRVRVPRSDDR